MHKLYVGFLFENLTLTSRWLTTTGFLHDLYVTIIRWFFHRPQKSLELDDHYTKEFKALTFNRYF